MFEQKYAPRRITKMVLLRAPPTILEIRTVSTAMQQPKQQAEKMGTFSSFFPFTHNNSFNLTFTSHLVHVCRNTWLVTSTGEAFYEIDLSAEVKEKNRGCVLVF